MRVRLALALGAALLLGSSAIAADTPSGVRITPDPETTPDKPIGAQARAKNGPDPTVAPPTDVGMADDPTDMPALPQPQPQPPAPTGQ